MDRQGIEHGLIPSDGAQREAQALQKEADEQAAQQEADRVYEEALQTARQRLEKSYGPNQDPNAVQKYLEALDAAQMAKAEGVPLDLLGIVEKLQAEVLKGVDPGKSGVCKDLSLYLKRKRTENPGFLETAITASAGDRGDLNVMALVDLNVGPEYVFHGIGPLRNVTRNPISRPRSPGQSRPSFWIGWNAQSQGVPVVPNAEHYADNHPERVHEDRIQRYPFMQHPNEDAWSLLSSIPFYRLWDMGEMYVDDTKCAVDVDKMGNVCNRDTRRGCEDTTHFGNGVPICDECENESRQAFAQQFLYLAVNMRQYFCANCTTTTHPDLYWLAGKGVDVYYHKPNFLPVPDFSGDSISAAGLSQKVGGWKGNPLPITGCACALKLFGRRICNPHRMQYMIDMATATARMKTYINSLYGREVCPKCKEYAGCDKYLFTGGRGGYLHRHIAWVCLVCHGYVYAEPEAKDVQAGINQLFKNNSHMAPYQIRREERNKAGALLAKQYLNNHTKYGDEGNNGGDDNNGQ